MFLPNPASRRLSESANKAVQFSLQNISDNEWVVNNRLATTQQVVKWLMSNRVGGGPLGRALQQILIDIISTADRGWWPSVPAAALNRTQCSLVASNYFTKHWQHVY